MTGISEWLIKQSSGWRVLLVTVVFVLFMILVLPGQAETADDYAQGSGSPDTSFFYTPERLFELADVYGEEGRQAYVRARFSFDLIFPFVYGIFFVTTISWLLGEITEAPNRWRLLNLGPILGVIFDLLENISTSIVMLGYPEHNLVAAQVAPIFTLVKWNFVSGSFIALLIALGYWAIRKLKRGG